MLEMAGQPGIQEPCAPQQIVENASLLTWREHYEVAGALAVLCNLLIAGLKGEAAHGEGVGEGPAQRVEVRPTAREQRWQPCGNATTAYSQPAR